MMENLQGLMTEEKNSNTTDLDCLSSREIVQRMNDEDKKVPYAVENVLDEVAKAVDMIVASLENEGRLFYFGAGTSGRLGILDASECPPTFGTPPELVQGVIAGGQKAMVRAVEGAEDSAELGRDDVRIHGVTERDVVVGIAASGRTPYVLGALKEAQAIGAKTISVSCNETAIINEGVDVAIGVVVGPEVLTGSTRLKAGTAQKLVLNMLTTASMIRLGKVYGNLMVNVQATNQKLRERVKRIIMEVTGVSYMEAEKLSTLADGDAKTAILMRLTGTSREEAMRLLKLTKGRIREAIQQYS
ncbi:N-acetylmuramic acid-6-phosphate etherase [Brevibacillus panacihumi W25]|uniref:N-acetylmuramic acid 6-phosphate etherase n=1 Tax=Brevibacillus panacihumi W25 TaxID=1408254 RepID=V6MI92_9BACL|nr:N-acetylmuramic acid 6-phosphate etherase [Brevibacillus panacihumi]EST55133.1 N-acetylmuramic acid-6-phosphate etherase [Brevibacillus panacihumi W25]